MAAYICKKLLEIELLSDHYSHLQVFGITNFFRLGLKDLPLSKADNATERNTSAKLTIRLVVDSHWLRGHRCLVIYYQQLSTFEGVHVR